MHSEPQCAFLDIAIARQTNTGSTTFLSSDKAGLWSRYTNFVFFLSDALHMPKKTTATQNEFGQAVQKWLRHAPDRTGGLGIKARRETHATNEMIDCLIE